MPGAAPSALAAGARCVGRRARRRQARVRFGGHAEVRALCATWAVLGWGQFSWRSAERTAARSRSASALAYCTVVCLNLGKSRIQHAALPGTAGHTGALALSHPPACRCRCCLVHAVKVDACSATDADRTSSSVGARTRRRPSAACLTARRRPDGGGAGARCGRACTLVGDVLHGRRACAGDRRASSAGVRCSDSARHWPNEARSYGARPASNSKRRTPAAYRSAWAALPALQAPLRRRT